MITKEELHRIEEISKDDFIRQKKLDIQDLLVKAARKMERTCEVPYHPLLDTYFSELVNSGLKVEIRKSQTLVLSWLI